MPRLVDVFARRLQMPERLTTAIAEVIVLSPVAICRNSAQKEQIAHCLDRYEGIADTIVELFQPHGSGVIASSQQIKPHSKRSLPPAINIKGSLNRLECV
jgi:GTP cyclohydrolase I